MRKYRNIVLFVTALVTAFSTNAIGLSTFRIYMDDVTRHVDFVVKNSDTFSQKCNLEFSHLKYSRDSKPLPVEAEQLPEDNALGQFRFSPKRFSVAPMSKQTVKFSLKRTRANVAKEFRSYVVVTCFEEKKSQNEGMFTLLPQLAHKIPIVIRRGSLAAEASFEDVILQDKKLTFTIKRQGERSIYGDVKVIDPETSEVVKNRNAVVIYPESDERTFQLSLNQNYEKLKLEFVERQNNGGNLVISALTN